MTTDANRVIDGSTNVFQLFDDTQGGANNYTLSGITGGEGDLLQVNDSTNPISVGDTSGGQINTVDANTVTTAKAGVGLIDINSDSIYYQEDDTLNINFGGAFYPIPFFSFSNGIDDNNRGLHFSGGEGNDTLNLNGGNFKGLDFYNNSLTGNRTIRLETMIDYPEDGTDGVADSLYAQYFDVEKINVNPATPLDYLYWGGVAANETINITNPCTGKILIDSDVATDVETTKPVTNFRIYGDLGNNTINLNNTESLVSGSGAIYIGNNLFSDTVNLNQTAHLIPNGGLDIKAYQVNQTTPITGGDGGTLNLTLGSGKGFFNQNNTYTGQTILNQGVLNISTATALGTTAGNTIVKNDGELYVQSSITVAEALELDGELGVGGVSGVNVTWSGDIVLTDDYPSAAPAPVAPASTPISIPASNPAPIIEAANASDTLNITGVISGDAGVDVTGTGKVIFSAVNTYTGTTTVEGGVTLQVNGSTEVGSTFEVNEGTLCGIGTVNGAVTISSQGILAPGNSAGILNTGNLSLNSGSTFNVEIGGTTAGTNYDQVNVTGTVLFNGSTLNVSQLNSFVPSVGNSFTIINNDGTDPVTSNFLGLNEGAIVSSNFLGSGNTAIINYAGGSGNDVVIKVVQLNTVAPPPTTGGTTNGTASNDIINVSSTTGSNRVDAGTGNDYIIGSNQTDNLFGGAGNDSLFGNGGIDNIRGGDNDDLLNGGADNVIDSLYGEAGADLFVINANNKKDNIYTFNPGEGDRFKLEGGLTFGGLTITGNQILLGSTLLAKVYSSSGTLTPFTPVAANFV